MLTPLTWSLPYVCYAAARRVRPLRVLGPVSVRAFTSTEQQVEARAWERQLPLGAGATVIVQVFTSENEQRVSIATNREGRLLLHWGVEGGNGYKGGWRLPDERCRPEGTVMYKNRALQTPFRQQNGSGVQVGAAGWVRSCQA